MKRRLIVLFYATCFILLQAVAQNVTVETSIDSTSILIGEQLTMRAKVSCPKGADVRFPDFKSGYIVEGVEMLEASQIDTAELNDGKRWELTRDYVLTSFDSAVYNIPRLEVTVNGRKYQSRNEIGLKVNTVDVDLQHPDELRPLKAPVDDIFQWSRRFLLESLLSWLFGIVFILSVIKLSVAKPATKRVKITPPTPPQKTALEAIAKLQYRDADREQQKLYYVELTNILRVYISERFGFNALEMTSYEIVERLRQSGDAVAISELQSILSTADLVKFAKYEASLAEDDRALLQATDYIRTTQVEAIVPKDEELVKEIVVSDKTQQRIRRALIAVAAISALLCFGTAVHLTYQMWLCFW